MDYKITMICIKNVVGLLKRKIEEEKASFESILCFALVSERCHVVLQLSDGHNKCKTVAIQLVVGFVLQSNKTFSCLLQILKPCKTQS